MDKKLVVKQNAGYRVFWIFMGITIVALWLLFLKISNGWDMILISFVFLIPLIAPIYYLRWKLVFYQDEIAFRKIFRYRCYSYSQIKSVKEYDRGHHRYILISLSNGKKIEIWHTHMNYGKCRNELLRHMSIEFNR